MPHNSGMASGLELALVYLLAAVVGVAAFRLANLPPMLGYLVVGVLIGPHTLALSSNSKQLQYLAEFGVVFLMFTIGLEFSLTQLRTMRRFGRTASISRRKALPACQRTPVFCVT